MTAPHAVLKKFLAPGKAKSPGLAAVEISDLSINGKKTVAKRFGRGRITGLALIAVLTLGLGYLHFAGSATAVSVPAGAHAGQNGLGPAGGARRPADHAPVHLSRRLPRRLRDARRAREPP